MSLIDNLFHKRDPEPQSVTIDITAKSPTDVEKLFKTPRELYAAAIAELEAHMTRMNQLIEQERKLKRPAERAEEIRRELERLDASSRAAFEAWLRTSVGEAPRADLTARRVLQDELALVADEAAANAEQLIPLAISIGEAQQEWAVLSQRRHDAWIGCVLAEAVAIEQRRREAWLVCAKYDAQFHALRQLLVERNAAGAAAGLGGILEDPETRWARKEPHRIRLAALQADARSKARSWALAVERGDVEASLELDTGNLT